MWRDPEKEKSLGRFGVLVWVDLEMSKIKKLEEEIKELKDLLLQLQGHVIALQARVPFIVPSQPSTSPGIQPTTPLPTWPPYFPYIGDPPPGLFPTITCGTKAEISGSNNQISRCCK